VTERDASAERVARNDAIFRDANERIDAAAKEYDFEGAVPFICECPDPACNEILRLRLDEYETVRSVPTRFVHARGHVEADGEWATVVERRDGYDVVEKVGRAADLARELDPRAE
jgi:hypothetical protein